MKVIFMGTPSISVPILQALIQSPHSVVAVYTQPDRPAGRGLEPLPSPIKQLAESKGLPVHTPTKWVLEEQLPLLKSYQADLILVAAYGHLLKQEVLDCTPRGCYNIHFSLLPRWRGAAPLHWSLLEGDTETGITFMRMVLKCDAGPLLLQKKQVLAADETLESLEKKLTSCASELALEGLAGLAAGTLSERFQNEAEVTWAPKVTVQDRQLQGDLPAFVLERKVRAFSPSPSAFLKTQGLSLKIKEARVSPVSGPINYLFQQQGKVYLGTPEGSLELLRVQWESRKEIPVSAWLQGLQSLKLSPLPWAVERVSSL